MSRARRRPCALLVGGLLATGTYALADDQAVPLPERRSSQDPTEELAEIVVTGSRIARPDSERLEPTTILTSDYLNLRAYTNVIDALDELPAFGEPPSSRVGAQTSEGVGQSFADLYGLGAQRTLTLVDGRRFVGSATASLNGATEGMGGDQVDLNAIPTKLIDRIEIASVGGAPIYGTDAIAGTVNIILKHDYEGLDVDAQGGLSGRGDAGEWRVRTLAGKNFDDGRGNLTFNAEFANLHGLNADQRARTADNLEFVPPSGSSSYQEVLASNVRVPGYSLASYPALVADGWLGINPNYAVTNGAGEPLAFSGGHLVPYDPGRIVGYGFRAVGGDGLALSDVTPLEDPQQLINATLLGDFKFSDRARVFGELWYSETHDATQFNLTTVNSWDYGFAAGQPGGNLIIPLSNPFLSNADRALILKSLEAFAAASPANPQQTSAFYLSRVNADIGDGATTANENTKRFVLGVEGVFPVFEHEFKYEVSGNYGEARNFSVSPQPNWPNFQNALNAVVGPGGKIICNPYQSNGKPLVSSPYALSSACAPFNPFGNGISSPAALAYVTSLATETSSFSQRDFNAQLTGPLFSLPAGAVRAAFGYENRRESSAYQANPFLETDPYAAENYANPFGPIAGAYLTNEAFAELLVPAIGPAQSARGAERLEFEGAVREVHHSVAGSALAWTAGLRFEPLSVLQFRGNYTRSIRAPSVTEAFLPPIYGIAYGYDPCDQSQITSGPDPGVRAANCRKAGITQPFDSNFLYFGARSLELGNPNLRNEIADARAFGLVWRPGTRARLSIDFIKIDVSQAISDLGATDTLNACYDSPTYPNPFCSQFTRNSAGQLSFVRTGYANTAYRNFGGIQAELAWSFDVPCWRATGCGTLDVHLNEFYLNQLTSSLTVEEVDVESGELGMAKHKGVIALHWRKNRLEALWQARFASRVVFANGIPANFSAPQGLGTWWVNDLSVGFEADSHLKLELVIDNLFDAQAPYPLPATPFGSAIYTGYFSGILGRYFTLQAAYRF